MEVSSLMYVHATLLLHRNVRFVGDNVYGQGSAVRQSQRGRLGQVWLYAA